jgi:hypothetical protein
MDGNNPAPVRISAFCDAITLGHKDEISFGFQAIYFILILFLMLFIYCFVPLNDAK